MAETPKHKKPAKKGSSHVDQSKKKVVASPKKKFNLSKTQWGIVGLVVVTLIGVGTYFGLQTKQDTTADAASCVNQILKLGSKNSCVKAVQRTINTAIKNAKSNKYGWGASAYYKAFAKRSTLVVDGNYGSNTEKAVLAYQKYRTVALPKEHAKSLTQSGKVDYRTWVALCHGGHMSDADQKSSGCGAILKKGGVNVGYK